MKNIPAIFSLTILLILSCNQKPTNATEKQQNNRPALTNSIMADSVKVSDSAKVGDSLTAVFSMKTLVFPKIRNKTVLDSIYAQQNIHLKKYSESEILSSLNRQKEDYFKEIKNGLEDFSPQFAQSWYQNSAMNAFSELYGFVTLQYTADGYTGGAHGYYNEMYKVFDLKENKTLQLQDIVQKRDAQIWDRILMAHFLKDDLDKGQAQMLLVKQIPLNNNFYFDEQNLYFLYNQYEIAAYAAGPVMIKVPFTEIKPLLAPTFRARLDLK